MADGLSAAQRTIAEQLHSRQRELAYASAAQVARELEVSASSVVRFAQTLGYDGWPALQEELRDQLHETRLLVSLTPESAEYIEQFVSAQGRNLAVLAGQAEAIERAAAQLASARTIWLAGDRASAQVAAYAANYLRMIRPGVRLLPGSASAYADHLLDVEPGDALWLTSMSRYSRNSLALARDLRTRLPIVLLTNEETSPLLPFATTTVLFATQSVSSLPSDVAAYATAHVLVLALARRTKGVQERLERAETLWARLQLFAEDGS
jgi:DNA-binding MurR/RpiR family transcriptional regulator